MIKYIKIYNEFIKFISALDVGILTEYEKRLLNIIINDFDNIAELGTKGRVKNNFPFFQRVGKRE